MHRKHIKIIVSLLALIIQACSSLTATPASTTALETATLSPVTPTPTETLPPTATAAPLPTPIPVAWKQINTGQDFERDIVTAFVIDSGNPDLIYLATQHSGYFKSVNSGKFWEPVPAKEISGKDLYLSLNSNKDSSRFSNTAPDGIKRLYRYDGFWYVSTDGGTTWQRFSEGGTYRQFNPITFDVLGAIYIFCGDNICKFDPDGKLLNVLAEPRVGVESMIALSPKDPKIIYAAGEGFAVSKDGGITWAASNDGLGNNVVQLEAGLGNSSTIYLLLGGCNRGRERSTIEQPLYRSTDGGTIWEFIDNKGCFLIKDADGKSLYRLATDSDNFDPWIWLLSNNGRQWDKLRIPSAITTLVTHPSKGGVLYGYDSQYPSNKYISEDYGYSWNRDSSLAVKSCYGSTVYFIDAYRPIAIDPRDGNHVFVIDNGTLLESHDSCDGIEVLKTVPNTHKNSIVFDPNNPDTLYVGADDGAYMSLDSGKTWNQINEGLLNSTVVYSIAVDKDGNVYAATPFGIFQLAGK
jgi:hypothetical protein